MKLSLPSFVFLLILFVSCSDEALANYGGKESIQDGSVRGVRNDLSIPTANQVDESNVGSPFDSSAGIGQECRIAQDCRARKFVCDFERLEDGSVRNRYAICDASHRSICVDESVAFVGAEAAYGSVFVPEKSEKKFEEKQDHIVVMGCGCCNGDDDPIFCENIGLHHPHCPVGNFGCGNENNPYDVEFCFFDESRKKEEQRCGDLFELPNYDKGDIFLGCGTDCDPFASPSSNVVTTSALFSNDSRGLKKEKSSKSSKKSSKKSRATSNPTSSPSASPSSSPSASPSAIPSSSPSASPSAIPSSTPSASPSAIPSSSPSAFPSASPSDSPSSSPSGESDRQLRLGDPSTCASYVEIKEIEETLVAMPEDKREIMENLKNSSSILHLTSIGLSRFAAKDSTDFITQTIAANKIAADLIPLLDQLDEESRKNFNSLYQEKTVPEYDVEMMQSITSLKEDFKFFISSRSEDLDIRRVDRTVKFRQRCNAIDSRPIDMFRYMYGYGCGARGNSVEACAPDDLGECGFGPKGPIHVSGLPVASMDLFYRWMSATSVELSLLHAVCLPATADVCNDLCVDRDSFSMDDTSTFFNDASQEVFSNVVARSNCQGAGSNGRIEVCRVNERGYPVSSRDPEYDDAQIVYASEELSDQLTGDASNPLSASAALINTEKAFVLAKSVIEGANSLLDDKQKLLKAAAVLGTVAPILSIALAFVPVPNPTLDAIKAGFKKVNARFDELSSQLTSEIRFVVKTFNEDVLDQEYKILQKINAAFSKYLLLSDPEVIASAGPNYGNLVELYTEDFRFSCNELESKPEDVVRNLYGYACGEDDFGTESRCKAAVASPGDRTGTCRYGPKKENYILDKFFTSATTVVDFRRFASSIQGALLEALFLQAVCLPPIKDSCSVGNDFIRQQAMELSVKAVEEVETNLEQIEDCFCPCGVVEMKSFKLVDPDISVPGDWRVEELSFRLNFTESSTYSFPLPGQDPGGTFYGPQGGTGELVDEDKVIDINGKKLRFDRKNFFYIVNESNTFVLKKDKLISDGILGIPIDFLSSMEAEVTDYDLVSAKDVYKGNLTANAIKDEFDEFLNKCSGDGIVDGKISYTIPLKEGSSEGEFVVNVILKKLSECAYPGSDEQWCSTQSPNCPQDTTDSTPRTRYCDLQVNKCKTFKLENETCDEFNDLCLTPNECFDSICQELPAQPCQKNADCDSATYCDNDNGSCMPKIDIDGACTDSGQCLDSYCDGSVCTAFGERGAYCDDDKPCNTDIGSTCVDNLCKDSFDEDCFVDGDCGSAFQLYCADGKCQDRQTNGGSCTRGSECETFYCNPTEFLCADKSPAGYFLV